MIVWCELHNVGKIHDRFLPSSASREESSSRAQQVDILKVGSVRRRKNLAEQVVNVGVELQSHQNTDELTQGVTVPALDGRLVKLEPCFISRFVTVGDQDLERLL